MQHYLLDENLSRKLTGPLSAALGDVSHVANEGLNNAFDLDIWEFAKKRSGIILTKDTDYVGLSDLKGCPPKVIKRRSLSKLYCYRMCQQSKISLKAKNATWKYCKGVVA